MHELAIAQSVVDGVVERLGDTPVGVVHLVIGRLSGVDVAALGFCFDLAAEGTTVEGAHLDVDEPAGRARCRGCGAEFEVVDLLPMCRCGSVDVEVCRGQELLVRSVEVA